MCKSMYKSCSVGHRLRETDNTCDFVQLQWPGEDFNGTDEAVGYWKRVGIDVVCLEVHGVLEENDEWSTTMNVWIRKEKTAP